MSVHADRRLRRHADYVSNLRVLTRKFEYRQKPQACSDTEKTGSKENSQEQEYSLCRFFVKVCSSSKATWTCIVISKNNSARIWGKVVTSTLARQFFGFYLTNVCKISYGCFKYHVEFLLRFLSFSDYHRRFCSRLLCSSWYVCNAQCPRFHCFEHILLRISLATIQNCIYLPHIWKINSI